MKFRKKNLLLNILVLAFSIEAASGGTIYIIPPGGYEREKLFDLSSPQLNRDNCIKHFFLLREKLGQLGYQLKTATAEEDLDNAKYILVCGIRKPKALKALKNKYRRVKLFCILSEPVTVEPQSYDVSYHDIFDRVYIMDDTWVDNKKYFKFFYPHPSLEMIENLVPFEQKKLCTMITGGCKRSGHPQELYSERMRAVSFFQQYPEDFKHFGRGWKLEKSDTFGGPVSKKEEVLKKYKFSLCFENSRDIPGYITEKIFDCFHAGCVPIYYGAPNIQTYVPESCFIDFRKFSSYQELYEFLINMPKEHYENYITSIRNYLTSEEASKFSLSFFVETIIDGLFPVKRRLSMLSKEIGHSSRKHGVVK